MQFGVNQRKQLIKRRLVSAAVFSEQLRDFGRRSHVIT
jgi:hypothetical protein